MGKPTVHDIAREAGVSLATVDRVLNARPGVRSKTVERVQQAVQILGYVRNTYAANLARQREYRFVFVLPEDHSQFVETLNGALAEAAQAQVADGVSVRVVPVPSDDPNAVGRALDALDLSRVDGVAIMTPETPQVRDALARLKTCGIAVAALVSDQPNTARDHFVGINSLKAGRTAASLMGHFVSVPKGKVLVVASSLLAHDSIERRLGFDQVMASEFPTLAVLPSIESHDDPERLRRVLQSAVVTHPDIVGVYSMGSRTSSVLDALRPTGRQSGLAVIAHELTPVTRAALVNGEVAAVITQNTGHLVRSTLRVLRAKCDNSSIFEAQERIRIEIVIRENLP